MSWRKFSISSLVGVLLLVVIPVALTVLSVDRGFRILGEIEIRDARLELAQEARQIRAYATPEETILARFYRAHPRYSPRQRPALKDSRFWPSETLWIQTPPLAEGGGFGHPSIASSPAEALARLPWFLVIGSTPDPQDFRSWEKTFGMGFDARGLWEQPGYPYPVTCGRTPAWLLWDWSAETFAGVSTEGIPLDSRESLPARAPVNLVLAIPPDFGWRLEEALRHWLSIDHPTLRAAVVFPGTSRWMGTPGWERGKLRSLIRGFLRGDNPDRTTDGRVILVERLADNGWLILEKRLSKVAQWEQTGLRTWGIPCLLLAGILLFQPIYRWIQTASLSVRLLGMFGYVILFPLVGVVVLTFGVLADRASLQRGGVIKQAGKVMRAFDEGFRKEIARTERTFRRLLKQPSLHAGDREGFSRVAGSALEKKLFDRLEIRDWQKEQWLQMENRFSDEGLNRMFAALAEYVIVEFGGGLAGGGETATRRSPLLLVMQELFEHPFMGFHEHLRKPGRLLSYASGNTVQFWFWQLGKNRRKPAAFISFLRSRETCVETYLNRHLIRNREFRLVAFDGQTGQWFGLRRPGRIMKDLTAGVLRGRGREQSARLRVGGKPFLAIGFGSRMMGNLVLLALIPESSWEGTGLPLRSQVELGVFFALLVGVGATWLVTSGLLVPIRDLSEGIDALRRREQGYLIPIRVPDELGRMATAFNRMLANVQDQDVAREIHETIMPLAWPDIPGFRFDLRVQRSAGVGGDYGEVIPFQDGRFGILLGDVSGTGASGALVVAMVKASVALFLEENGNPEEFLYELNGVVQEVARPNRFACAYFLLTPKEHQVEVYLAGYPFPFLASPSAASLKPVGKANYPLGTRKNIRFIPQSVTLEPGDLLFSFSDGLAQARNSREAQFGYDRVETILKQTLPEGPSAMLDGVESALAGFRGSTPLPDDVSFSFLARENGKRA